MYKDDNITGGCSDAVLRRILEGRGNLCPTCENGCDSDTNEKPSDSCMGISWGLSGYPLASVYAPLQSFENIYDTETAIKRGTVFKELDLPFLGDKRVSGKGGTCRG